MVRDANSPSGEKFPLPMWPFRHMSMESMSVLSTAMNESMLQSYDGVIRIAPAFSSNRTGRFTLHAEGGFIISSEIKTGEVQWICIKSLYGNTCMLELPWKMAYMRSDMKKKSQVIDKSITEITTKPNEVILITRNETGIDSWSVLNEVPLANEKVKYHSSGKTRLGIPRMF